MRPSWSDFQATKLEAAKRQLDAGIRCYFRKEEAEAAYTLAFAAFGILKGLAHHRGGSDVLAVLEGSGRLVGPKAFRREYNKLGNFLKHADKGPDNAITGIGKETNEALLFTCCALLKEIEGLSSAEWRALWLWYHGIHFENPAEAPDLFWEWAEEFLKELHASERDKLIEIGVILLKRLEATKSI